MPHTVVGRHSATYGSREAYIHTQGGIYTHPGKYIAPTNPPREVYLREREAPLRREASFP